MTTPTYNLKKIAVGMYGLFLLCLFSGAAHAQQGNSVFSFSVVPQQSASKTAAIWRPILAYLSRRTGHRFKLKTAKNIPTFESRLERGDADFSYMNPYHYTVFHEKSGYNALARAKDKRIKGIIVVHKDSPIKSLDDLNGQELAFPSPAAFAASILPRGYLKQQNIEITPKYVSSHDSVYLNVSGGRFVAGGGIIRTLNNTGAKSRAQLRILWTTAGYTPHAIAAHSRVGRKVVEAVQAALISLHETPEGRGMLKKLKLKGFMKAIDSDWDDVRALKLKQL